MVEITVDDLASFAAIVSAVAAITYWGDRHRSPRNSKPTKWRMLAALVLGGFAAIILDVIFEAPLSSFIWLAAALIAAEAVSWLVWRVRR